MQLALFSNNGSSKTIEPIPVDRLRHSPFNPRRARTADAIDRLAERISRNGYEITRAVWAHPVNAHYEVFAGGTRLEAAKTAGLQDVPAVVHRGFSNAEIVRLAELDNENDEYHEPVPITDVWLSYKALADEGWTQQQIADAKGCSQGYVSYRMACADFPPSVMETFINKTWLNERHALELIKLSTVDNLPPWLTREQALLEIIEACQSKAKASEFRKVVARYNKFIAAAEKYAEGLDASHCGRFLRALAKNKVRTLAAVRDEIARMDMQIAEEKRTVEDKARAVLEAAEQERLEAERQERLAQLRATWFADHVTLLTGPLADAGQSIPDNSVALVFTDPPYAKDSVALYGDLAQFAARVLKPGGSLIAYAGHSSLPDIFPLMTPHLRYWWTLALEHGGQNARLEGVRVFVHWKPLLWFVKERRAGNEFVTDMFTSKQPEKDRHEWAQDESEAAYYIEHLTEAGQVICDPFCGSGTTLCAAVRLGRRAVGIDKELRHVETTRDRLDAYYAEELFRSQ